MTIQRTFSIVKPDAMGNNVLGRILSRFEEKNLRVIAGEIRTLSRADAETFYAIHRERPFFGELVAYMSSGPVFIAVLEGENAVALNREIMGATDPKKAAPGTLRADFGESIEKNAVHGSDSPENAALEIQQFFPSLLQ
jgi:nucleoside-diphosphate kinase